MWTRAELKNRSKLVMKRNYWNMFAVTLIAGAITFFMTSTFEVSEHEVGRRVALYGFISLLVKIFLLNPLECGKANFFLKNIEENQGISELFYFFQHDYTNVVTILFIRDVKIALWTLLLVIPGIVKTYEYRMIPYLLAENSSLTSQEVFAMTKEVTAGNKFNIFVLDLSFIGWYLLGGILVIGILFVYPYYESTCAELYAELRLYQ